MRRAHAHAALAWEFGRQPNNHAPTMMRLLAVAAFASGAQLCPPCFHLQNTEHGNRTRQSLRWLHVPKTGSTFQNSIFHWACPGLPYRAGYGPGATPIRFAPPARSMDEVPWNSSTNTWRPGSSCPSKVRRPRQEADAEAEAPPPRRPRRRPRRRVVRLAPPPGIRPASAPKPWGHHRLVGGFFPPAPLEGRHGVSPGAVGKYRG